MKKKNIILITIVVCGMITCGIAVAAAQNSSKSETSGGLRDRSGAVSAAEDVLGADRVQGITVSDREDETEASYRTKENGELDIDYMIDENGFIKEEYLEEYYAIVEGWKEWSRWFREMTRKTEETQAPAEPTKYDGSPLTEDELAQLEALKEKSDFRVYPMEEAKILGGVSDSFRRMTLEEFMAFVEDGLTVKELEQVLYKHHKYADMAAALTVNNFGFSFFDLDGGEFVYFNQTGGMEVYSVTGELLYEIRKKIE